MIPEQIKLLDSAKKAAQNAYAPYSKFNVGAAVITEGGIFLGANIENSCTNLGICAERVAISSARVNGCKKIIGIAVFCANAPTDKNGEIKEAQAMPCGGCRQWIAELAPDAWLVTNASQRVYMLDALLPLAFTLKH